VAKRVSLAAACVLLAQHAVAQQATNSFEVSVGARASDNIARVQDGTSGTTVTAGLILDAERKSGELQYAANADLDYLHYFNQAFSSEVLGQFTGTATYQFIPQSISWVTEEHLGQVTTDYFLAPGPRNRQYLNLFSTGPDVRLRLADTLALRLSARYGRDDYQTSPYSDARLSGEAALERRPSESALVSLGFGHERINYVQEAAKPGDFAVNRYFAGYALQGAVTTIDLQAGYAQSFDGLVQLGGPTGHIVLQRKVGAWGSVDLNASRTLDTVTPGARATDFLPGVVDYPRAEVLTGTLFFANSAELAYRLQRPRNSLDVAAVVSNETDHKDIRPNRDTLQAGAKFMHRLTPLAQAGVFVSWMQDTLHNAQIPGFPTGDFKSAETDYGLQLRLRFSRVLVASLDLTRDRRVAELGPFRESAVWVRMAYAPVPASVQHKAGDAAPDVVPR